MPGKHLFHRQKRKIGEVFMVNRVELALLHELKQMRKFHRHYASRLEEQLETLHKIIQIWNMCQNIVPDDEISRPAVLQQVKRGLLTKKKHLGIDTLSLCYFCDIGGRLDTQHRNSTCHKILQEVPVIARDLDHLGILIETIPRG